MKQKKTVSKIHNDRVTNEWRFIANDVVVAFFFIFFLFFSHYGPIHLLMNAFSFFKNTVVPLISASHAKHVTICNGMESVVFCWDLQRRPHCKKIKNDCCIQAKRHNARQKLNARAMTKHLKIVNNCQQTMRKPFEFNFIVKFTRFKFHYIQIWLLLFFFFFSFEFDATMCVCVQLWLCHSFFIHSVFNYMEANEMLDLKRFCNNCIWNDKISQRPQLWRKNGNLSVFDDEAWVINDLCIFGITMRINCRAMCEAV